MKCEKRILHLGLGRFHRAHQAVYYQRMAELGDSRWGTTSLSMRSTEARDQLRSVENKYPVLELSEKNVGLTWVESICDSLDAQMDFEAVLQEFSRPELEIISLTITEKGYCLNASGELDLSHQGIQKDLKHSENPQTAIGILALGLKRRSELECSEVTVLSCDNLRENGKKLKVALETYLKSLEWREVLSWIQQKVSFPNSMVDRIVPSLTPEKISEFEKRFNLKSGSQLIATEEFTQWVIEDDFIGERPPWEKVGVEFVEDVHPYEEIKLRLLNASHSFLAYSGLLKGHRFVHEAIADEELKAKVELMMLREVVPLLDMPADFNVVTYEERLIERFRNGELPHQLKQIAMDGSQKLPLRILPSLIEAHRRNSSKEILILAVVSWLSFVWETLEKGEVLDDPEREKIAALSRTDKLSWGQQMLEMDTFKGLRDVAAVKEIILQKL